MAAVNKDFVIEASTTTGTGAFTLAGAVDGLRTFASVCSIGDTVRYIIKQIDGDIGNFEVGEGVYSSSSTLTRTSVVDSSNAGALVDFSAGLKNVYMGIDATRATWARERLFAARTYYVRTDGSDSNNGLANTSGGAFLTIQKAVDVVSGTLDLGNYDVTIQCNDATRTAAVTLKKFIASSGKVLLVGNSATPANCVISTTSASCFTTSDFAGPYSLDGFKFVTTTSGTAIDCSGLVSRAEFKNVNFGACATAHISAVAGASCSATGNYAISGSSPWHYGAFSSGIITVSGRTVTISGTPAFSVSFALSQTTGIIVPNGNTFSGSATGARYNVSSNGVINTAGGGATYLPGNSAGSATTGGQYV